MLSHNGSASSGGALRATISERLSPGEEIVLSRTAVLFPGSCGKLPTGVSSGRGGAPAAVTLYNESKGGVLEIRSELLHEYT